MDSRPISSGCRARLAILLLLLAAPAAAAANECSTAWRGVLNVHDASNAGLRINNQTQVWQTGDRTLGGTAQNINQQNNASCFIGDGSNPGDDDECLASERVRSFDSLGLLPSRPNQNYTAADNIVVQDGETQTINSDINPEEVTVEPGGELIISGAVTINVRDDFSIGDDAGNADRATVTVNGVDGELTRVFATNMDQRNADLDVTAGSLRLILDNTIGVSADSDLNCGTIAVDGEQRSCTDTDGDVFGISRSKGEFDSSRIRGAYYVDGNQFNMDDVVFQGAATGGGIKVAKDSDVTQGKLPNTEGFCEQPGPGDALTAYQMEQFDWVGDPGEVEDVTGNGNDGTAFGGATTAGADPAIAGDPGTCRYGTFDGNGQYIEEPDAGDYLNGLAGITVMAWVRNTGGLGNDNGIFATTSASGKDNNLGMRYDQDGFFTGNSNVIKASINTDQCNDDEDCLQVETESDIQRNGEWQHIAFLWETGKKIRIFVDGREVETTVTNSGIGIHEGTIDSVDFLRVGRSEKTGSDDWQGDIDEFLVFDGPLTALEIRDLKDDTHPCPVPGPARYRVSQPGTGITCAPVSVIIEGLDDDGDPAAPTADTVLSLFTDTDKGTWSRVIDGSGTLDDAALGDGEAAYTFPGGETATTLSFDYPAIDTDPEEVVISVDDGTATGTGDVLAVSLTAFRFLDDDATTGVDVVSDQIAGKPSDTGAGASAVSLQAIRASDEDPTTCEGVFDDGDTVAIELGAECRDPATCAGEEMAIAGVGVETSDDNGVAGEPEDFTTVELEFGDNSAAPIPLAYADAGATRLYARHEIRLDDPDGTESGVFIRGTSSDFTWRPFGFHVDADDADTPVGPDETVFVQAGENFDLTVRAVAWADEDDDGTGQPAADADLGDNATTPNFGNEAMAPEITLEPSVVEPADGSDGALSVTALNAFSDGEQAESLSWTEVGFVDIEASLGDYLGAGPVNGAGRDIGRFIPADFEQTVEQAGEFEHVCDGTSTYLGQEFGYSIRPALTITARNTAGATTLNYTGEYAVLAAEDIAREGPTEDNGQVDNEGDPLAVRAELRSGDLEDNGDGTLTYRFPHDAETGDRYAYDPDNERAAALRVAPFAADLTIDITEIEDRDGVTASERESASPASVEVRFGRMTLGSRLGSELASLALPIEVRYWDGETWVISASDGCTRIDLADEVSLEGSGGATASGDQAVAVNNDGDTTQIEEDSPVVLSNGEAALTFAAPDATGWVDVDLQLFDAAEDDGRYPYLRTGPDADGDGDFTVNPRGRASFGLFGGNPNQIYREEVLR